MIHINNGLAGRSEVIATDRTMALIARSADRMRIADLRSRPFGDGMEINDFLAPSQILINRHASGKANLLDHLARRAAAALGLPHATILSALLKREELGSTGMGDGVAVPHARLPGVSKSFGILARLNKAIDFNAIDGEPVDVVCLLLLPTNSDEGQHALASAARVLRDAEVRRNLRRAADHAEAFRALVAQR